MLRGVEGAGCEAVCFAGKVERPDFAALKPDLRGVRALPGAIAAARKGDDALLRFSCGEFEKEGFARRGGRRGDDDLTLADGPLGALAPTADHAADIARPCGSPARWARWTSGRRPWCAGGLVLAVEAQEGTDAMLARVR